MSTVNELPGVDVQLNGTSVAAGPRVINIVTAASGGLVTVTESPSGTINITIPTGGSAYQPLDTDLTAIAALTPTNDDVIQRKAGAWANRTMVQLTADLASATVLLKGLIDTATQSIAGLKKFITGIWVGEDGVTNGSIRFASELAFGVTIVNSGAITAERTQTPQDASGVIALTSNTFGILSWCQNGNFNSNSTGYTTFGLSTTTQSADNFKISLPACTIKKLKVFSSSSTLNGDTVVTIRKNGSDTAVTCTIASGSTTGGDASNSVAFAEDDEISIKVATAGNSGVMANIGVSVVIIPT